MVIAQLRLLALVTTLAGQVLLVTWPTVQQSVRLMATVRFLMSAPAMKVGKERTVSSPYVWKAVPLTMGLVSCQMNVTAQRAGQESCARFPFVGISVSTVIVQLLLLALVTLAGWVIFVTRPTAQQSA